jgi:streptogramin lyase
VIVLALAGAVVVLSGCSSDDRGGDATSSTAEPTSSTVSAGPQPAEIEATVEVGSDPIGIAAGNGSLWVVNAETDAARGSVSRIDPTSGDVLATVRVGVIPLEVAVGEGGVWVSNADDDTTRTR